MAPVAPLSCYPHQLTAQLAAAAAVETRGASRQKAATAAMRCVDRWRRRRISPEQFEESPPLRRGSHSVTLLLWRCGGDGERNNATATASRRGRLSVRRHGCTSLIASQRASESRCVRLHRARRGCKCETRRSAAAASTRRSARPVERRPLCSSICTERNQRAHRCSIFCVDSHIHIH